ncbi:uncharacterized protein LOC130820273 isoform X3 [Amaranthus tricolor]|uniref:uncharacterized protein LOC130820273 isoform X3 n=1 Tax=Amaranthus tricolor TaxID=29722 RepID=UPI00258E5B69|nr:uncharacterized protein LOC130820273 isoform X3 [Amaranthus tricolor]
MASLYSMVITPPFQPSIHLRAYLSPSLSPLFSPSFNFNSLKLSYFSGSRRYAHGAKIKAQESEISVAVDSFTQFKHLLLPITDRNPYLSEGTRQAAATTAALAKKYGADITVLLMTSQKNHILSMIHNWRASDGICPKVGSRNLGC